MVLFLQEKERKTCYMPKRLGAEVLSSLVTFALCDLRPHWVLPRPLPKVHFLKLLNLSLWKASQCFTRSFNVHMFDLYLAHFVPQRYLWVLYCAHWIELILTRKVFHRIVLPLSMPKMNHLGPGSCRLNQHWLLSPV